MGLPESILGSLQGYSLAKYSTWFYYKADRLLLDCGEGVSLTLQNFIYGIKTIFLSHSHGDHILGLQGFLASRASSMGDHEKAVHILFPRKDRSFERVRSWIKDILPAPPFEIGWHGVGAGDVYPLNAEGRILRTFATGHLRDERSLGACVVEVRSRLRSDLAGLPQSEIVKLVGERGREAVTEKYEKILLAYGGDSPGLDPQAVKDAEVLLHEATFLSEKDMEGDQHATVDQALEAAVEARVKTLVLFHFSTRYPRHEVKEVVRRAVARVDPPFPVYYTFPPGLPSQLVCLHQPAEAAAREPE